MKHPVKSIATILLIVVAVVFFSCSSEYNDESVTLGGESVTPEGESVTPEDTSDAILDLRIKNGTEFYKARGVEYEGEVSGDTVTTPHVTAKVVSNGIQFDITKPDDECYDVGFGVVLVYRMENGKKTTGAKVQSWGRSDTLSFVYPLCEAGEKYRFNVQIEPQNLNDNRDCQYFEYIEVTAMGGIGDIDYSNIGEKKWVAAGYVDSKPRVKIEDCIPPEAKNVGTYVDFFGGTGDIEENNATVWVLNYVSPEIELTIEPDDTWFENFRQNFTNTGKTQFFAEYQFKFEIEGCDMIERWTTTAIRSDNITIE